MHKNIDNLTLKRAQDSGGKPEKVLNWHLHSNEKEIMNKSELLQIRLYNQLLAGCPLKEPQQIISWMGAIQSQSLDLAKWAIGVRMGSRAVSDVDEALNTGKIIRTHILRPTWHFVSAEDIHWMFDLSNPRLKPIYRSYARMRQVDEDLIYRTIPLLEKMLQGGKHLTKSEINDELLSQDKVFDINVLNQIIHYAEMEGILVNGQLKKKDQTFTLLEEWVPRKHTLHKEEALGLLARKFFTSHAPATLGDFVWWSGLTITECKQAIGMIKNELICETMNGRDFWLKSDLNIPPINGCSALLLPPFDEFVVSYKDRSELIEKTHYGKVMTTNGLFSPTVMLDGEIVGSWKRKAVKGVPRVELSFFEKIPKRIQQLYEPQIKLLEAFYSK